MFSQGPCGREGFRAEITGKRFLPCVSTDVNVEQRRPIERLLAVRTLIVPFPFGFAHMEPKVLPQVVQPGEFFAAHLARKQIFGYFSAAGMVQVPLEVVLPGEILAALETGERFANAMRQHVLRENLSRGTLGITLYAGKFARIGVDGLQVPFQIVVRLERFRTQFALEVTDVGSGNVLATTVAWMLRIGIAVFEKLFARLRQHCGVLFFLQSICEFADFFQTFFFVFLEDFCRFECNAANLARFAGFHLNDHPAILGGHYAGLGMLLSQ